MTVYNRRAARMAVALIASMALAACSYLNGNNPRAATPVVIVDSDVGRGEVALRTYGCGGCHAIPGVAGAQGVVGPPLDGWADRRFIIGTFPNQPQHLIRWIRYPQAVEPGNPMPDMGVTEEDARDMAAYLYTLRRN